MMVEWLFGMHVDKRPPLLQRTVFTLAARRQISTRLRPLVFLRCNVIGAATGSKLDWWERYNRGYNLGHRGNDRLAGSGIPGL